MDEIHRDVNKTRTRTREKAVQAHNAATHVHAAQFDIGDFVLVAKKEPHKGSKLLLKWVGPRRVTRALSEHTYEVQNILNEGLSIVHANRLKFYADSKLNITEELKDTIDHNHTTYNTVTKLLDLRFNHATKLWEVQAKWRGFAYDEPTWEPLVNMHEDIPDMLKKFLDKYPDEDKVSKARRDLAVAN
eukprot:IDg3434t1